MRVSKILFTLKSPAERAKSIKILKCPKKSAGRTVFSPSPHFKRLASAYRLSLAERVARAIELSPRDKARLSPPELF
jgi:hypothetical protein